MNSVKRSAEELSLAERRVLRALEGLGGRASIDQLAGALEFRNSALLMNAINWLKAKGYIFVDEKIVRSYSLRNPGGTPPLPERKLLTLISGGSATLQELSAAAGENVLGLGIGWLKKKGWVNIQGNAVQLTEKGRGALSSPSEDERLLASMASGEVVENDSNATILKELLSRKEYVRLQERVVRDVVLLQKGREALAGGLSLEEEIGQLTPDILKSGRWRSSRLRPYDPKAPVPVLSGARRHPLMRTVREFSRIFVEMGFTEIEDEYVQNAFWNMDVLFTPQDHPAREMQDTFYLSSPRSIPVEEEIASAVGKVHENGGRTGSSGWGYRWNAEEASRALLRTHTTVATIRYLAHHREPPLKVFSVGRIFRHEATDVTHLSEFHQIEGIVMERHASFDMLCGILKEFYRRIGFEKIRFRPGYFPYTEPSMEVDIFYNGRWIELGGSGMFRPEVLAPLGIRHNVLAWGLGLERLVMIKYGFTDVRDLYTSNLDTLRKMGIS